MVGSVSASSGIPRGELVTEGLEEKLGESLPPWVVAGHPWIVLFEVTSFVSNSVRLCGLLGLPELSVHVFQVRTLEWVSISLLQEIIPTQGLETLAGRFFLLP